MRQNRLGAVVLSFLMLLTALPAAAGDEAGAGDEAVKASINDTDDNNAYVIFGKDIKSNKMKFIDGLARGVSDSADPLYSENVSFGGVDGRKVYVQNYVYLDVDESFYQPGDSEFLVAITYWDFGPDVGYFHVEYNSSDEDLGEEERAHKRVSLMKSGLVQRWYTQKVYIEDADFGNKLPNGSDLRLVSNAFNAFAKVEITNISAAKRDPNIKIGTVNAIKAETLHRLGLYDGVGAAEYEPGLDAEISRQESLELVVKAAGLEQEVKEQTAVRPFTDVDKEYEPYVAYAHQLGIVSGDGSGTLGAREPVTKRELLTYYLRLLGLDDGTAYENAYELAEQHGVVEGVDFIFNIDTPATRDNFAGIAFNSLVVEQGETGEMLMNQMMKKGVLNAEQIKETGSPVLAAQIYKEPVKLPKKEILDPVSGRTINYMNVDGGKAIRPYVTQQHWTSDGRSFVVGTDKTQSFYEYNVNDETIRMLDKGAAAGGSADAVITPDDIMFYRTASNEIWKMDLTTYRKQKVADPPKYGNNLSVIQVTNDGKYITCYWKEQRSEDDFLDGYNRIRIIPRLDCTTGEWDSETLTHVFDNKKYPDVGHPIINPVYENLLFFCHEGTTTDIPDRLWIGDFNTGETRNLFIQAGQPGGLTGETSGHEVWAADGERMYFVKYTYDQNLGQSGLVRIDKDGSNREYLNGDWKFWHCYPSADQKWVVGDTQIGGNRAEIVLVNTETYQSYLLANIPLPIATHPYQAHPIISPDGGKVSWQMVDEDGMLGCAWMDISDIVSGETVGGKEKISDTASIVSYRGAVNDVQKTTYNGQECYRVPQNKQMYVDIADDLVCSDNAGAVVELTYCDAGRQPLVIGYTTGVNGIADLANRENAEQKIQKNGSKAWKTVRIPLTEANLHNAGKYRTDFRLGGLYSEIYVKDINIEVED